MTLRRKVKPRWPRRLVGDTAALRARYREAHPGNRVSLEPGSDYRAWLNSQRRQHDRRFRRGAPRSKGFPGDNPLLRRAFIEKQMAEFERVFGRALTDPHRLDLLTTELSRDLEHNFGRPYRAWLTEKGIDPATGKMTEAGLAFFRSLVERRRER
jgi:hypothetical protein